MSAIALSSNDVAAQAIGRPKAKHADDDHQSFDPMQGQTARSQEQVATAGDSCIGRTLPPRPAEAVKWTPDQPAIEASPPAIEASPLAHNIGAAPEGSSSMAWASIASPSAVPDTPARLQRLRRLAWLIDGAFGLPGTRFRFGLNSVLGLLPVGGDALLGAVSLYIVYEAAQLGVPRPQLARMLANVAVEVVGGSVPVLGDLFDMALKANLRNLAIIERHLDARL